MPAAVTSVNRDVSVSIDLAAGSIAKVKAAEVGLKTDVSTKTLFDKHPNSDKLLVLQMLAATYCSILTKGSDLSTKEKEQSWSKFQDRLLTYALPSLEPDQKSAQIKLVQASMQPLYFRARSTVLLPESRDRLVTYAKFLKEINLTGITVEGHTTPVDVELNMHLGNMRANVVMQQLIDLGINAAKVKAVGFGGSEPIAPEASGYNNRVVIRLHP